jgi:hypothetical protein
MDTWVIWVIIAVFGVLWSLLIVLLAKTRKWNFRRGRGK